MRWFPFALAGALAVAAAAAIARRMLFVVRVDGDSMTPAYRADDAVLVTRVRRRAMFRLGDVVVFELPPEVAGPRGYLVKRVAAVAGEPLPGGAAGEVVGAGRVFLQGDGASSYDSRAFGTVALDCVQGRVVTRLTRASVKIGGR